MKTPSNIAVLLPCHNEAAAIKNVIKAFQQSLPSAKIYVYDNCSTDDTAKIAKASGAIVCHEPQKGKGNVIRRMFADIDADIYVLADGDLTYDANAAPKLIEKLISENLDMVVGTRIDNQQSDIYRAGHRFGNSLFNRFVRFLFGNKFTDILSGYRVFSKRFIKSFPAVSRGFDTEVELTIHSLELRLPVAEIATEYAARPEGSESKLRSYRDGIRILLRILVMLKESRPLFFFGSIAGIFALLAIGLAFPLLITYVKTGLVPRMPTAILSTGMMLIAVISFTCGIVLDSVCRGRREKKYLRYLSHSSVSSALSKNATPQ